MSGEIILASRSEARVRLLRAAGVTVSVRPSEIDERAAEAPLAEAGATADDIAVALAAVKAETVSSEAAGALVIGADQTLAADGTRLDKPSSVEHARRQLLALSDRTHQLHSAVACARDGAVLWQTVETAHLTMRRLSPSFVGRYLAAVGEQATQSVGAYQIEGMGIQLFERIEGDCFAIQGLPMLPLLAFLRQAGYLDT